MCGIAGFVDFRKRSTQKTLVEITDVLSHRGPDDSGYSFYEIESATIGLGHRRLSIIDTSANGHQPMRYEGLEIIFNGEIYNFEEIREELKIYDYSFESQSDTEVILKAYHKWGISAVNRFNGMFAIALYDHRDKTLYLMRDKLGVKSLFFYQNDDCFVFGSEIKSIMLFLQRESIVNESILHEYMQYRFLDNYSTFVDAVKMFPRNCYCAIKGLSVTYHAIEYKPLNIVKSSSEIDVVEKLLLGALERQMISDVPLGFFLSGGLDSSLLVSMASKVFGKKVSSFSVSFENYEHSEKYFQDLVVKDSNTEHYNFSSNHSNYFDDFIFSTARSDFPHLIPNYTQIFQLSRFAKNKVTVLLSGEGADEIFGGYHRFSNARIFSLLNSLGLKKIFNLVSLLKKDYIHHSSYGSAFELYLGQMQYAKPQDIGKFTYFNEDRKRSFKTGAILNDMLEHDQAVYLHGLLQRVDSMTMLASIEARVPFLDLDLVGYVNALDFNKKVGFRSRKKILYEVAKKYVPQEIITRSKLGFPLPLESWFASGEGLGSLKFILLDERSRERGYYNQNALKEIFSNSCLVKQYSQAIIFPLLSLELWIRLFIEKDSVNEYRFQVS